MTPQQLVRLYPKAWRARYGDEFVAMAGSGPLRVQQVIDIVAGAIDAHLSPELRRLDAIANHESEHGAAMARTLKLACGQPARHPTVRDSLTGAGVMVGATIALLVLGIISGRQGWDSTADILKSLAFPAALTLSMPFTYLKGQAWKTQATIIGATFIMLFGAVFIASRISIFSP